MFRIQRVQIFAVLLLVATVSLSCASRRAASGPEPSRPSDQISIENIRDQFEDENFTTVVNDVRIFMSRFPGSRYLDEAMFLLARAEYENGNFLESEGRFRKVLKDFPNGAYAEDSSYYLALSLLSQARKPELDQTETQAAQAQFRGFLQRFPESEHAARARKHLEDIDERFAEKSYKNGETYRKLGDKNAAEFYYQKVWTNWPLSKAAPGALLRLAEINYDRGRYRPAVEWARLVVESFPESDYAGDAQSLIGDIEKTLGELPPRAFDEPDSMSAGTEP